MYSAIVNENVELELLAIAAKVSSFFFDPEEGFAFVDTFEKRLNAVMQNPDRYKRDARGVRRFDISYRGFNYIVQFVVQEQTITITDIYSKRQKIWFPE